VLRWDQDRNPIPLRAIRQRGRPAPRLPTGEPPPWLSTGPTGEPFHFSEAVKRLAADIAGRCEELRHIDVSRILFGVTQARTGHAHGLQARVTPFRFRHGALSRQRRGIVYQVQRYFLDGREIYYLVTFCLPRFLEQSFDDKFVTLFHELYHISPLFDGDLRRHGGRYSIHSHSQKQYDRHMADLARDYLASQPDPALHAFLRLDFAQLVHRHRSIVGVHVPRPQVLPLPDGVVLLPRSVSSDH
jgi:hypothetical protein